MRKRIVGGWVLALLLVSAGAWTLWQRQRDTTATQPQVARAAVMPVQGEAASTQDQAAGGHDHGDGHAHDGDDAPNLDLRAHYFDAPALVDGARFAAAETPLLVEASCRAQPLLSQTGTAEERLKTLYAMDPAERFPTDLFYRSMLQFWRDGDEYYQLSAIWDIGIPPVYRLALHRSPVADFSRDVREAPLPQPLPGVIEASAAAEYMARTTNAAVARGAQLGLQLTEAQWPTEDGRGSVRTTLANGRAMGWNFPGGHCNYDQSIAALRCRCPSGSGRAPGPDEQPGTS